MQGPILLLTKKDVWCTHAALLARALFGDAVIWEQGKFGDGPPPGFALPSFSAVLSFVSPWIVPAEVLKKSPLSLNFHPGSCDYPGIGCYNFALYENAAQFGPVCHHMLPAVDSGTVVHEALFSVSDKDSVETLKLRTMVSMLSLFHDMLGLIAANDKLPTSPRQWTRKAFTRKQLDALCEITPDMSRDEADRRIRATTYPGYPGPYMLKGAEKHYYPVPPGPPLA